MYRGRVAKDLAIWVSKGLLDQPTAEKLLKEYDAREATFSVGRVLMILAAVLVSAAILLLIASNWDAVPRVARVVGIVGLIWAFYISAALCSARGWSGVAAAFLILATMSFGGAIALVGQMYHLSGDAIQAVLVWFAGACVTTVLFRSAALAVLSGLLSWAVFASVISDGNFRGGVDFYLYVIPLLVVIVLALVRYTHAGPGRHLAYLLLLGWLVWLYFEIEEPFVAFAFAAVGAVCFLLASLRSSPLYPLAEEAGAAPGFYSFAVACLGLIALHFEVDGTQENLAISATTLVTAIGALSIAGRLNGAARYLAYAVFAGETLYVSFETVGSIIGTSGFFLISGLIVAFAAWLVIRLEKRFAPPAGAQEV